MFIQPQSNVLESDEVISKPPNLFSHPKTSCQVKQQYRDFYHRDQKGERNTINLDETFRFHCNTTSVFLNRTIMKTAKFIFCYQYFASSLNFFTSFNFTAIHWKRPLLGCLNCIALRQRKRPMRKIQSERICFVFLLLFVCLFEHWFHCVFVCLSCTVLGPRKTPMRKI